MRQALLTDERRITEQDADFQALRHQTERKLRASVALLVRGLRHGTPTAISQFLRRHVGIMRDAYIAGHHEGQKDYWEQVSNQAPRLAKPDESRIQQALRFYVPSVTKLATEAQNAANQQKFDDLGDWQDGLGARIALQADLTWSAFNDGYIDGGNLDKALPFLFVWWVLELIADHCTDCLEYAAGSPYGAPGTGNNELDATPGDGHSVCGAACKCNLQYGPGEGEAADWTGVLPPDAPLEQLWPKELPPMTLGLPGNAVLTPDQKDALDAFRAAWDKWEVYRGGLSELPDMFDPEGVQIDTSWDDLSPKQQEALGQVLDALKQWLAAGGGQQMGEVAETWEFGGFDPSQHPHKPKGPGGGQWMSTGGRKPRQHHLEHGGTGPRMSAHGGGGGGGGGGHQDDPLYASHAMQHADHNEEYANRWHRDPIKGDRFMVDLLHEQGRDGLPEMVTEKELDAHIKGGERELWRGFTQGKWAEEFTHGQLYMGHGTIGNGIYTSAGGAHSFTGKSKAEEYTRVDGPVLRMSLKSGARTVMLEQLRKEQEADIAARPHMSDNAFHVFKDAGRYAALRGYDAIIDPHFDEVLVINRGMLRVQKENA